MLQGLRVPGIVAWPGRVKPGGTSAVRTPFTDVHATLVEAAGLPAAKDIGGRSILPVLVGKGSVQMRDYFVWFSPDRNQSAVLFGGWKGVWMRDTLRLFTVTRQRSRSH
jgi:arylsulfatase A-like enzyme